jgi:hypothetical protein
VAGVEAAAPDVLTHAPDLVDGVIAGNPFVFTLSYFPPNTPPDLPR